MYQEIGPDGPNNQYTRPKRKTALIFGILAVAVIIALSVALVIVLTNPPHDTAASNSMASHKAEDRSEASGDSEEEGVDVSNAIELFDALESGVTINLLPGDYDLAAGGAQSENSHVSYTRSTGAGDPGGIVLSGLSDVTIRSSTNVLLYSPNSYDTVIKMEDCDNVTFENVRLGHSLGYDLSCFAPVVYLTGCSDFCFEDCNLFGCGTEGFVLSDCDSINFMDCDIHDCLFGAFSINSSEKVTVSETRIYNNGREYQTSLAKIHTSKSILLLRCEIYENGSEGDYPMFSVDESSDHEVALKGCRLSRNDYSRLSDDTVIEN